MCGGRRGREETVTSGYAKMRHSGKHGAVNSRTRGGKGVKRFSDFREREREKDESVDESRGCGPRFTKSSMGSVK